MTKEEKQEMDELTIARYEHQLKARRKHYTQSTEAISQGGRRNRALAAGECVLKGMELLDKLNFIHPLLPGTLSWIIGEDKVVDPDGKKGYRYTVAYHVYADEQAMTDEEIAEEVAETRKRIEAETEEMYAEYEGEQEEDGESAPGGEIPAEDAEAGRGSAEDAG